MTAPSAAGFKVKRIYEEPEPGDGYRVLVDRLWPRGMSKDRAAIDLWARELAPSTELRRWYGHEPEKTAEFRRRYEQELTEDDVADLAGELSRRARHEPVTLLTATRDVASSHASVLAGYLSREG